MITTGSVRGKCSALQAGHSRFQPPCTGCVAAPQFGQKRWRACQCSTAFASAIGGRWSGSTRPCTAIERKSVTWKPSRLLSASAACGVMPKPKRGAPSMSPEEHRLGRAFHRARLRHGEERVAQRRALLHDDHVDADDIGSGARVGGVCGERCLVGALFGGAFDAALRVAEARFGAEIGAGRHAGGNSHGADHAHAPAAYAYSAQA